jgi:hypothetical protein
MSDLNTGGGGSAAPSGDANPSGFAGIIFNTEPQNAQSTFK